LLRLKNSGLGPRSRAFRWKVVPTAAGAIRVSARWWAKSMAPSYKKDLVLPSILVMIKVFSIWTDVFLHMRNTRGMENSDAY
jgi:hypothetical protein